MAVLMHLAPVTLVAAIAASRLGPSGNAFYMPPSPLPPATHGDVIWARPLDGATALSNAAKNVLVLYHTTFVNGQDVAVSGTVAIPRGTAPAGGWPVISWAHGTTGNAPQCAPSRDATPNSEQRMLNDWVEHGYAVLQTDYEGQGTPGIHPYYVGQAGARDTTDMVRAARQVDSQIGSRWIAMGHSEGGSVALFAAAFGQAWAPELQLLGTVSYAPGTHITMALDQQLNSTQPTRDLPMLALMIQGIASSDPAIRLDQLLSARAQAMMPELQKRCIDDLMDDNAWTGLEPENLFRPGANVQPLVHDFLANEPGLLRVPVPVLLLQGAADNIVDPGITTALDTEICSKGANVTYETFSGKDHGTLLPASLAQVERWVDARFAGERATSNCGSPPATF
jgi:pimeloyl-ACP methyl ester carboxylesterase